MGIINNLEKRAGGYSPLDDRWYYPGGYFYGGFKQSKSGASVNEYTAMQLSVVWACIRILSETVSSLPLFLYKRKDNDGKERAKDHPHYRLLHIKPNPEMTAMTYRECQMAHIASWGNCYSEIVRNRLGYVKELWPIPPNRVTPKRNDKKELYYEVTMPKTGEKKAFSRDIILHIPGLGFNGLVGYSPITMVKEAIGLGIALEEFGANYFGQGTHPGLVVKHPKKLSAEAHANLKKSLIEKYSGLGNEHRLLLLEEAMEVEKIGIPPNDSQFIESRKYTNIEIGTRIYRIPPHMYGEMDRATFSNIEQQAIEFVMHTIRPWLVRLEQSYNTRLLPEEEQEEYFFEHNIAGLLRGDAKTRSQYYREQFRIGALTINQINAMENRNPIGPLGDKHFVELNMVALEDAGKDLKPAPQEQKSLESRKIPEERVSNAVKIRNNLARAWHRVFLDAGEQIVAKETKALKAALKKNFQRNETDFNKWIDKFYGDFPDYIRKKFMPVLEGYAESVKDAALDEIGSDVETDLRGFLDKYAEVYSANYINSSIGQLRDLMNKTKPAEMEEALNTRVNEWEETRAGKIADSEVVNAREAVAREAWIIAGMTGLVWVTQGSDTCPFCRSLNGKVIGITQSFVKEGDIIDGGEQGQMKIKGNHFHPQLHGGCQCSTHPTIL